MHAPDGANILPLMHTPDRANMYHSLMHAPDGPNILPLMHAPLMHAPLMYAPDGANICEHPMDQAYTTHSCTHPIEQTYTTHARTTHARTTHARTTHARTRAAFPKQRCPPQAQLLAEAFVRVHALTEPAHRCNDRLHLQVRFLRTDVVKCRDGSEV